MTLPPSPPGCSPTLAYEPQTASSQRAPVIAGLLVATAAIAIALHVFGGRPYAILIPVFLVVDAIVALTVVRGGVAVGRDWIAIERWIGIGWLHSSTLRKIEVDTSSRGAKVFLEDERGKAMYVDIALLRRSPSVWKPLHAALRQSAERGCAINARARSALDL